MNIFIVEKNLLITYSLCLNPLLVLLISSSCLLLPKVLCIVHGWSWMEISHAFSSTPVLNQDSISESESLAWDGRGGKKLNLKSLLKWKIHIQKIWYGTPVTSHLVLTFISLLSVLSFSKLAELILKANVRHYVISL